MKMGKFAVLASLLVIAALSILWVADRASAQTASSSAMAGRPPVRLRSVTPAQREAAAVRAAAARQSAQQAMPGLVAPAPAPLVAPAPGGTPDVVNYPNYANSPLPTVNPATKVVSGGIRKFVDTLPGLGPSNANNLGQYIPIAIPDTISYPGSDYYQIGLVDYRQKLHSDLSTTKLRGYKDLAPGADGKAHYLGPLIIARRDRAVRVKFTDMLSAGSAGDLFLPVDNTIMGAGMGPDGTSAYTQNRAVLHLHGGATPWISDGTPHQWITPAGETATYKKGDSQQDVPDMPDPGPGSATYYWTNQQSARLMFYHDHSYGMTRLDVYAGEAAGYLLTDPVEDYLINSGVIPDLGGVYHYGIPLIIQDKTFVDAATIPAKDPTWNWGTTPPVPHTGDLWFPHVYMPNENPADVMGVNAMGRWDYGPWISPPVLATSPTLPDVSIVPEAFMDTPIVNGAAYPTLPVECKAYRFRILNACNDRTLNLQLYYADPSHPTEVKMVAASPNASYPATWPKDGRDGGVPNPTTAGPPFVQIGTEGGLLPQPAVIHAQPVDYDYDRRSATFGNVTSHALMLGPAERADVIVDFSQAPAGSSIILYNDAPVPMPAFDTRDDYYTGDPDQTATGGAPTTLAGYGPNTRTVMQFTVSGAKSPAFNLAALQAALPAAFAASQPAPIVPEVAYGAATNTYAKNVDTSMVVNSTTIPFEPKSVNEDFDPVYGRMNATLGTDQFVTNPQGVQGMGFYYVDVPTEFMNSGDVQIWHFIHNGVDTHSVHFHLFNVQLINRVDWAGLIRPPDANEVGWKETLRMNPLEDLVLAIRPVVPRLPFAVPDSIRLLDVSMPLGSTANFTAGQGTVNALFNFGWEYVWHCHLLGHEENDMMRPLVITGTGSYVTPVALPLDLTARITGAQQASLAWTDNSNNETGFRIERATGAGAFAALGTVGANVTAYDDPAALPGATYTYRVFAYNIDGDSLPSNTATVTASVPAAPSGLIDTASGANSLPLMVSLAWSDNSNNESRFSVQRATNSTFTTGLTTFTAPANSTTYADATVLASSKYYYRLRAVNAIGKSAWSNVITVNKPGMLPTAASNLQVVSSTRTSVTISWTDNSSNEQGFRIQRSTAGGNGPWSTIATVPASVTVYTNTGLSPGKTYWYYVRAYNANGLNGYTNVALGTTKP